jgi:hypothetical protein
MVSLEQGLAGLVPTIAGLAGVISPGWVVALVVLALGLRTAVDLAHSPWLVQRELTRREELREQARARRRAARQRLGR